MYNEYGECEREKQERIIKRDDKGNIIPSVGSAGGRHVKDDTVIMDKRTEIIAYIKSVCNKRGIVLSADAITGKSGVGEPSTKKYKGYGSSGAPGLLQKALSCKDEIISVTVNGKAKRRFKWKVILDWEIKLIGVNNRSKPLKERIKKDGSTEYIGLIFVGNAKDMSSRQRDAITEYAKSIRCPIYVDSDGFQHIKIPIQYDRKAIEKKVKELTGR